MNEFKVNDFEEDLEVLVATKKDKEDRLIGLYARIKLEVFRVVFRIHVIGSFTDIPERHMKFEKALAAFNAL